MSTRVVTYAWLVRYGRSSRAWRNLLLVAGWPSRQRSHVALRAGRASGAWSHGQVKKEQPCFNWEEADVLGDGKQVTEKVKGRER